jgi:Cu(I)/Ag(I) efflux system membrane protein CusA/SilA
MDLDDQTAKMPCCVESVLFNVRDRDLGSTVEEAQDKLNTMMTKLPKGYYVEWSGQWENQIVPTKHYL